MPLSHIIDQANEIKRVKQTCLSEECDGQTLCKALLHYNHSVHPEFLELTSGFSYFSVNVYKFVGSQQHWSFYYVLLALHTVLFFTWLMNKKRKN